MQPEIYMVLDSLSRMILSAGQSFNQAMAEEGGNPDRISDRVKYFKQKAETLRRIRESFEEVAAGEAP